MIIKQSSGQGVNLKRSHGGFCVSGVLMLLVSTVLLSACAGNQDADLSKEKPVPTQLSADGQSQSIIININHGYKPARVMAKAGLPLDIEFVRNETSPSCAKDVEIPLLQKSFQVPNNGTYQVKLPARQPGKLPIQCSMAMMHGVIEFQ